MEIDYLSQSCAEQQHEVWSIGIYTGNSLHRLSTPPGVVGPVLSQKDVTDIRADFVADPFMIFENGTWYMFFEVMNAENEQGEIGLAVSNDGLSWGYRQIVLKEPFHLSYPYVFKLGCEYYMIPETLGAESVLLYKAVDFPTVWSCAASLLPGVYADPSIFQFNDKWWMFACPKPSYNDFLRLYYADHLTGRWREHPKSPIVESNACIARPGGRVTVWKGRPIRFTQDCLPSYGSRVRAFTITHLTPTRYSEREMYGSPILSAGNDVWNSSGMHHIDPHLMPDGKWIACVDGWQQIAKPEQFNQEVGICN